MSELTTGERAEIDQLLDLLDESAGWLQMALRGCDDNLLRARSGPDEWSALDVLIHLRASDELLTARIYQLAVRDGVPLADLDERRWAELGRYALQPVDESLRSLATRRRELLTMLRLLPDAIWRHRGQHETRGALTLTDVVRHLAEHEAGHRAQLEAALGRA
jgi:hypothetical protein